MAQSNPQGKEPDAAEPGSAHSPYCLVVEDDPAICKALSFTLRKLGIATDEIGHPAGVDAALDARAPQLILLDLGLGTAAGSAGALEVLSILARRGFPGFIQLMSGRAQSVLDEVARRGEEAGLTMLPVLTKPFRMGVVKEVAARVGLSRPGLGAADG